MSKSSVVGYRDSRVIWKWRESGHGLCKTICSNRCFRAGDIDSIGHILDDRYHAATKRISVLTLGLSPHVWTNKDTAEKARRTTEQKAFEKLLGGFETFWPQVIMTHRKVTKADTNPNPILSTQRNGYRTE